ncbi:MAG: hypothetical protein M3345_07710 [Actinomycetota bacterium]|nr:hypothetical protein [Actinomycetota bacterium]
MPDENKTVIPVFLAVGLATFVLGVLGYVLAGYLGTGPAPHADAPERAAGPPPIKTQWKFKTYPVAGKVPKRAQAAFRRQRVALRDLVRQVYLAAATDRKELKRVAGKTFSKAAAARFLRSGFGLTGDAAARALVGRARIGIDADAARRAAGLVTVTLKATAGERPLRLRQRSTLWFERERKKWRVIAFEIEQARAR